MIVTKVTAAVTDVTKIVTMVTAVVTEITKIVTKVTAVVTEITKIVPAVTAVVRVSNFDRPAAARVVGTRRVVKTTTAAAMDCPVSVRRPSGIPDEVALARVQTLLYGPPRP